MCKIASLLVKYFKSSFQIDGLVHLLKSCQIVNLCPTRVFTGTQVFMFCKLLQFKRVTPMSIKNIMFIGEVFQIEVSAGLAHSLGVDKM